MTASNTPAPKPKLGRNRGNAGKGRPRGVPNKTTGAIKDMILQALDRKGGVDYLVEQADENPVAFMGLLGKVMPTQLEGPGANGEHLHSLTVKFVRPGP